MDVTPTVLDLIGVTPPDSLHGTSLVPYLESTELPGSGRPAFSEYGSSRLHTVQLGDWKLVDNPDHDSPYCLPGAPEGHYPVAKTELYNLADDPLETTNLADQYPEKSRRAPGADPPALRQPPVPSRHPGSPRRPQEKSSKPSATSPTDPPPGPWPSRTRGPRCAARYCSKARRSKALMTVSLGR